MVAKSRKDPREAKPRAWHVHYAFESKKLRIPAPWIKKMVINVLKQAERDIAIEAVCELNVVFTDDKRIRGINREFRNKDKATDVLSFPQFEPREIQGKRKVKGVCGSYLGDLVISTETTLKQAKQFGVTPREELVRLVVHGILHLCGYDHEKVPTREAQAMRRRESVIRKAVNSSLC